MGKLDDYYVKFNEEKRLNSRHGRVEFIISMKYIHDYLPKNMPNNEIKILDVGAGTGRYAVPLVEEGFDVTAVEPVAHNLSRMKQKSDKLTAFRGNALDLSKLKDETFDLTIFFGPMYHLIPYEEKKQALLEAKRVTKTGGTILVAYCMNEYSVITYAFKEKNINSCIKDNRLSKDFHVLSTKDDLYDYVRVEDINKLKDDTGLIRQKLISPDGPANYMRPFLNQLSEEEFLHFVDYQMSVCERPDLIGAGAHTVDILKKI